MRRGLVLAACLAALVAALVALPVDREAAGAGTRASSVGPHLVRVLGGLQSPVLVTYAPGERGRLYVVEQRGLVRMVENGKLRATPFLDVTARVTFEGEQGLLGLAFPKDYARSHFVYVNYTTKPTATDAGATVIDRYRVAGGRADPETREQILTVPQPYENHNGGNLVFGPDGKLWVGLGDGGSANDPENRAQDRSTVLGKLFTLDVAKPDPKPVLVAVGLRNPWRYSFDRATGDLWIGDVGQDEFEEVDVLRRGTKGVVNFGWSAYEARRRIPGKSLKAGKLVFPVAQYSHSLGISVTGGYVYRGKSVPSLRGRYLYGDFGSGTIWSMPARGGRSRVERVKVPQLASFGEDERGELYAVSHAGTIYRFAR